MKHAAMDGLRVVNVRIGRVESQNDHIDTLETHDSEGFGPAPVVADAHSNEPIERAIDFETSASNLEVSLLQFLKRRLRSVLRVPRYVDLSLVSNTPSIG